MLIKIIKRFGYVLFLALLLVGLVNAMEVAITVDDLPLNGELPRDTTRLDVVNKMLATFKKHHITGVYLTLMHPLRAIN